LGFCRDNWGSYIYWRLQDPIFVDDKTDFYSQSVLDDYTCIYLTNPGWQDKLAKYKFNYILIPRGLPLEFLLRDNKEWTKSFEDNTAVLYIRNALSAKGGSLSGFK
jgi:hypothetical protein